MEINCNIFDQQNMLDATNIKHRYNLIHKNVYTSENVENQGFLYQEKIKFEQIKQKQINYACQKSNKQETSKRVKSWLLKNSSIGKYLSQSQRGEDKSNDDQSLENDITISSTHL